MLKDKTRLTKIGAHSLFIRIPHKVRTDSQFPFSEDEELVIEIVNNEKEKKLVIKKKRVVENEEV